MKAWQKGYYLLKRVEEEGEVEVREEGVRILTQEKIIEEQSGWDEEDLAKDFDFTTSSYWMLATGNDVSVIIEIKDHTDIVSALSLQDDDIENLNGGDLVWCTDAESACRVTMTADGVAILVVHDDQSIDEGQLSHVNRDSYTTTDDILGIGTPKVGAL